MPLLFKCRVLFIKLVVIKTVGQQKNKNSFGINMRRNACIKLEQ